MVFSSLSFLYLFLPVSGILYYLGKGRAWRNAVLLAASLVFYAWGEPKNIVLLLLASLTAWLCGLWMERLRVRGRMGFRRAVFVGGLALLTGNLVVFKYLDLLTSTINGLTGMGLPMPGLALPIGISFYTFQILSYLIDLYRGDTGLQRNYFYLTLYVSLFPQLIAGPIVRYQTIEEELRNRQESLDGVARGARRFIFGLAKKVILANNTGLVAEAVYRGEPGTFGTALYWLAALAYALQIYFDFSGYSDMAIGLGEMFGFHFPENFDHPYASLSITEFWRRWHISLSTWFRDYIYIPLGGNRVGRSRWAFNLLVVWALTGLWHGAQWNFILWGLYYGVLLMMEKLFLGRLLGRCPKALRWMYTMLVVLVGWVIFNLTDFARMAEALKVMFSVIPTDLSGVLAADASIAKGMVYLPLGLLFSFPLMPALQRVRGKLPAGATRVAGDAICLALLAVCVVYIIGAAYNPFIYFRF